MRRRCGSWVLVAALLGACSGRTTEVQSPPRTVSPRPLVEQRQASRPRSVLTDLAGVYRTRFVSRIETSCSESWDMTTYSGELNLTIERDGTTSLELQFTSRSVGGPWGNSQSSTTHEVVSSCRWDGAAHESETQLHLAMQRTSGNASMCDPMFHLGDVPGPELELFCDRDSVALPYKPDARQQQVERVELTLLTCRAEQRVSHLVHRLVDPNTGRIPLSADHRLEIRHEEYDIGMTMYSAATLDR